MKSLPTRRKFVTITAAAAGVGLLPFGASRGKERPPLIEWRGVSLGSVAAIRLYHPDREAGQRLIERVVAEARRLETIFTLYETDSVLCDLNRRGVLIAPPAELVDLLQQCDRAWHLTGGVFDPTVQPLWTCYYKHFAEAGETSPLPAEQLDATLHLVGWSKVRLSRDQIVFEKPGMGLTLNGIAQGYITDRVVDLLREAGLESCLVDMGEIRAVGMHPDGKPWNAALQGPSDAAKKPTTIDVVNKAVATSAADGFQFDKSGQCNHIFNPVTGRCADPSRALSVISDTAAFADTLSTAFALMENQQIIEVLKRAGGTRAFVSTTAGTVEL
ncbi:ApbE family lipoprotein [Hyphomicrobium denitrificans 1NES1]|uniref:FAD:protein FMN transferase n=1 Tax=Hyphomicrobium denitrificans 1NES1 TaxID=670307 RepID=N0B3H4_9HYPH|nr:FAD:protein FMN transferase [Hyphomicrobium denitrificans]AGK57513.1 ApbE family lipoprotein [Hyphomicrobium denitrificans 1NES1]